MATTARNLVQFAILGPLELRDGDVAVALGGVRERSLLAILLLNANELVSTDRIVDELWGDRPPKRAVKTIQVYVSRLRKILGADAIVTRPPGYVLHVDDEQFDLPQFERLAADGRRALSSGDLATARERLRDALALWRGAPLSDFVYEPFAQAETARLKELRVAAIEDRIEADLRAGEAAELVSELQALSAREPLRERLRGQLMLALYRSGRQADALDVYRDARTTLVEELGLEPGRELKELERAILTHDPALERPGKPQGPRAPGVFVGRGTELQTVLDALVDARDGRGGVLLLSGEPGIGKTRLADEVTAHARDQGVNAVRGRCWEDGGAPAYWPWVQLLRASMRGLEPAQLRRCVGSGGPELAELLPELRELLGDIPRPVVRDPEALRFRLFDSVVSFLGEIAATERPLLVVLDDLHAADEPSLLLLRFLTEAIGDSRLLVLGAYRDTEPGPDDALDRLLGDLLRGGRVTRIPLSGLRRGDVEAYVRLSTDGGASPQVVDALHSRTAGNPLFIAETVRLLAAENQLESTDIGGVVPAGVREAVHRRLAPLPDAARGALNVASVLGREFDPETLERLAGDVAVEGVDIAIAARLVTAAPGAPGVLVFSHALVRDALYDAIPSRRRRDLHRHAAEALERRPAADLGRHLAQLAHHFYEAAEDERARRYATQAAELAASRLAYEEAARLYRLALNLAERSDNADDAELCDLLLGLGDARARAGDDAGAKDTFLHAAEVARRGGFAERLGRAALGYGGRWVWTKGRGDPHLLPLLEEAVKIVPSEDSALRARLLARLAAGPLALEGDASMGRRRALSGEAVEIARRLGDAAVLAWVLDGRKVAIWAPDTLEEQWEVMDELQELAERAGDPEAIVDARICRLIKLVERADLDRFEVEYAAARRVADELGQPGQRWLVAVHEPMYALLTGRLAGAEQLIEQAFELGRNSAPWNARMARLRERVVLRGLEGRLEDVEEELRAAATEEVLYPSVKAALASLYADIGDTARCRDAFESLAGQAFAGIPFDDVWTYTLGTLAHSCSFLEDRERAAVLYERLEPYGHRNLVAPIEASLGSTAWPLGRLAATLGAVEPAAGWFERAVAANERMGALPWAAHARLDHARLLVSTGDHTSAEPLLGAASATYRELGMDAWVARCELATATA
jgi:DNA-binding SARP family transcriptional activator